jgi:hypothetical protein
LRASQFRICAALAVHFVLVAPASQAASPSLRFKGHTPAPLSTNLLQSSSVASSSKAGPDSCAIYGGPGSLLGKFQDALGLPDWQSWTSHDMTDGTVPAPVGDFAKLFDDLTEIDPCLSNNTPQLTFIDDGTDPNNLPGQSTGGEISPNWNYGAPGGWVVNFSGGASAGSAALHNEVWSPVILWDNPFTTGEDLLEGGCVLRYSVWEHLPLQNGIFHFWAVRSFTPAGGWSTWKDRKFLYFSETPSYQRREVQIADLLEPSATELQVSLGVIDLADLFGLPGMDATASPFFDDISVWRHNVSGPLLSARDVDLFQDSFPHSATGYNASNLANSAIRMDAASDLGIGSVGPVYGDSMVVRVVSTIPGASLSGTPQLSWLLRTNALFDPVRTLPSGSIQHGPNFWSGTINGYPAVRSNGTVAPDLWAFDMPDGPARGGPIFEPTEPAMFFPGDLLVWGVKAEDTNGNTNWLTTPPDSNIIVESELCGSGKREPQSEPPLPEPQEPTPGNLPGIWDGPSPKSPTNVIIPRILVWDDSGDPDEPIIVGRALFENGLLEGRDYDIFRTTAPSSAVGNGLGGRAGSAEHLAAYDILIYLGGAAPAPLLSDGTGSAPNDRSGDIGLLEAWRLQEADRHAFYFADNIGSAMRQQGVIATLHNQNVLGLSVVDDDVSDDTGLIAPSIIPSLTASFATGFVANAGCSPIRRFDNIAPASGSGAVIGHHFADSGGSPIFGLAASIWHDRNATINLVSYRRLDVTFPYALSRIEDPRAPTPGALAARSYLLGELLTAAGFPVDQVGVVNAPAVRGEFTLGKPWPNPFNPAVVIDYENPRSQRLSAKVFDLRGRHVDTLLDGIAAVGVGRLSWDGTDRAGRRVASGVYLIQIATATDSWTRKIVLIE